MKRPAYNPETIDEEFKYIATKLELKLMVWWSYFTSSKKFYGIIKSAIDV
jgi:hypothetical protein